MEIKYTRIQRKSYVEAKKTPSEKPHGQSNHHPLAGQTTSPRLVRLHPRAS